jgi:flagellar hook-length control protein FliK
MSAQNASAFSLFNQPSQVFPNPTHTQAQPARSALNSASDARQKDPGEQREQVNQGENALFASFLTLLTQAVERPEPGAPSVLNLKLSAEYGQAREEYTTNILLDSLTGAGLGLGLGLGKMQVFSKSVWDLMASLKGRLESEGIDLGALSAEVNETLESGMDAKAAEALLARLRERYATVLESGGPQNLGIEVAVSEGLKLGLEASLASALEAQDSLPGPLTEEQGTPGEETTSPAAGAGAFALASQGLEQPWAFSRFQSYLKPDSSRSASKTDAGRGAVSALKTPTQAGDADKTPTLGDAEKQEGSSSLPLAAAPREEADGLDKDTGGEKSPVKDAPRVQANPAETGVAKTDKNPTKTNFTDNKAAFEQFFENVTTRRSAPASSTPGLELARGEPFSSGETLTDGLNNVVRFIRAQEGQGGQIKQKAELIVDPPALGRVSVELISSSTGLEASLKVSSEQVRQLIQDHLAQLKLALAEQGVQLTQFSVDVQQDDARRQSQDGRRGTARARGVQGGEDEDELDKLDKNALFRVDLNQGLLYWVA